MTAPMRAETAATRQTAGAGSGARHWLMLVVVSIAQLMAVLDVSVGLFLFLTYYLQLVKGFSPLTSGLAFLPMIVCIAVSATIANVVTLPRFGPRMVITAGMTLGVLGLGYLSLLDVHSFYAAGVLPALIMIGPGNGPSSLHR
jgi:hypothetical protein